MLIFQRIRSLYQAKKLFNLENIISFSCSIGLAFFIFLLEKNQVLQPVHPRLLNKDNYLEFASWIFLVLSLGSVFYFNEKISFRLFFKKILLILFPSAIVTFTILFSTPKINPWISFLSALYLISISIIFLRKKYLEKKMETKKESFGSWLKNQGKFSFFIISVTMIAYLSFGIYNIGKFAAVDEALWTFDRIPDFWKDLGKANWNGTRVSDKPGVTVALISGIGMLFENPMEFKSLQWNGERFKTPQQVEKMNQTMRLPILIFTVLLIPLFYFFIEKTAGKNSAIFGTVFIGLAPPLVGMSRIINPDSLLWAFLPLSILAFFAYQKKNNFLYLFVSGFLLGIALLTKYIANILFVYFFLLIFLEFIHNQEIEAEKAKEYLKKSMKDFGLLVLTSITTFFALYPAVWVKPQRIFIATIQSEAFASTWPYFAGLILFILVDVYLLNAKIFGTILSFFKRRKRAIFIFISSVFLAFIFFAALNTYLEMKFFDFENILASPKSSYQKVGIFGVLFANFYPLVFGISPLVLFLIIFSNIKCFFKKFEMNRFVIYLEIFILVYYIGSSINKVASTVRYQIIIFPIALIIAAIESGYLLDSFLKLKKKTTNFILAIVFIFGIEVLFAFYPFYLSYASILLPKKYYLDQKDMGSGSYEAAIYLNSLPNPEKLVVWTDKSGVCSFFLGRCMSSLDSPSVNSFDIDYIVISSGRENRTTRIISGKLKSNLLNKYHLDELYEKNNPVFEININKRPGQYIKVIKIDG